MQIRLLLDANLSWRLISALKQHFEYCIHVDSTELLIPAKDTEIWEYAKKNNLLIVTNDEDFFNMSSFKGFPPKIILLRTGNQNRRYTEQLLIALKPQIEDFINSTEHGVLEIM
jgi:predicted nuclease of predicted toxin-antitoxin system